MNKIFLTFMLVILFSGLVSSTQQDLGSFDQGKCINLIQTCSNCSYVNISQITYQPTSTTYLASEISMTKAGTRYNYTFCNTSLYGRYVYDTHGDLNGFSETGSVDFKIGEELDITQGFMIVGQLAMIALFMVLGFSFSKERWKLRSFFFMMATGMGVILLNSVRIIASQSGRLNVMGNVGLYMGIISLLFMTGILLIYFTLDVLDSIKQKKARRWV